MSKLQSWTKPVLLLAAIAIVALIGLSPAIAQLCGNADGDGGLLGNDVFYLFAYLFAQGDPPVEPADLDNYELTTVRDAIALTWYLVEGVPEPICPPANPKLDPPVDSTTLLIFDEIFPAGAETDTIFLYMQNSDSVSAFTLPFRIRVDGQTPFINDVFIAGGSTSWNLNEGHIEPASGDVVLGALVFSRTNSLPPGFSLFGGVVISMLSANNDRPVTLEWQKQPPVEQGDSVNYPLILNNSLDAVTPVLAGACQVDSDSDLVVNCVDACPGFDDRLDADGDGNPDACDICPGFDDYTDSDADSIPDGCDQCPGFDDLADADADGTPDCLDDCTDTDGDGYGDPGFIWNTCAEDNCPDVEDPFQIDTDGDGVGNVCDNCLDLPNPDQADMDSDGVGDECDNCIAAYNPGQEDYDGDGFGNACDADSPHLIPEARLRLSTYQGSDVWGWAAPDGSEYALMGIGEGIAVVQTYPEVRQITVVPGPTGGSALWRDIKTYRHYMYSVSEQGGLRSGLGVADLQYLPDSVHYIGAFAIDGGSSYTSHNLSIDTARGYAYIEGDNFKPVHVMSLANPEHPVYVTSFDGGPTNGIHDMYAYNDTVWIAEGWTSTWSIWDLTNKSNPIMLARVFVPGNGYLHNIWPTPDHQYCITTEETTDRTIKVWDVRDMFNITMIAEYLGPSLLPHNAHVEEDVLWVSHYTSGIVAVDIRDPANIQEIAIFDTYPESEASAFAGAWGVYPHTVHGQIYASNMDGYLTILTLDLGCTTMLSGDITGDGDIGLTDVIHLINYLLRGGPPPGVPEMADVNCSENITVADVIYLVNYIFRSGNQPCEVCVR